MAFTEAVSEAVSVLLCCLWAVIRRQSQDTSVTSKQAWPTSTTQCPGLMATQAPAYMSPRAMEVPVKDSSKNGGQNLTSDELHHNPSLESIREPVFIAPPSTLVPDNGVLYFATVTTEHHPGTRLAEYDQEQMSIVHGMQVTNSHQGGLSGDTEARSSTASSILDLDGLVQDSSKNGGQNLTSDELHHNPSLESIREPVLIAPPSTPVPDKGVSYFATVTTEHHPSTCLAEYDREQTSIVHGMQVTNSRQGHLSGDAEARPLTASSILDLDGLIDERPWPPRDSFQTWVARSIKIAQPVHGEKF